MLGIPADDLAGESAVTLLYVQADDRDAAPAGLTQRLETIVERYAPRVRLLIVNEAKARGIMGRAQRPSSLLVLRGGELVGLAMGSLLPTRELDRTVRRAMGRA